jgi:hypothetical protein
MPINDARFKRNDPRTVTSLMEFLRPNFHIAYTLDELGAALADLEVNISAEELENLLNSLEYGGRIASRTIDGTTHYQYRKVRGFMPLKKMK